MENQPLPDSVPTLLVDETVLQSQPRISTSVPNSLTLFQETYKNEICHSEAFKNSSGHARTFEVVYEDPSNSDTAIKVPTFPEFTSTSLGVLNSGPLVTEANAVRIGLNQPQILFLTPESILGETTFNSLSNDLSSVMNATNFIDQTQVSMPDKMFHNRESLCRICASDTEKTLPLFRNDVLSQNLVRKIHRCLPIKILGSDDLPQQICEECAAKLQTSDEFVSLCLAGNTKLKEIAWMWSKLEGDSKKCEQDKEATSDDFGILQESTTTKESLLQSQSLQLEFVIKDKPKIVEELDLELCSPDNQDKETNQHSLGLEGKSIEDHTPVPHIPGNKDTQLNSTSMHDSKSLKISELEKRQWNCSECDYKASRQSSLSMHKQQKHAMDATESEQSLNEDIKDDSAKFVCQYCHRYFLSETKWENHLNSHLKVASYTNAKLLKCKLCNREFPNSRYLNKHLKTVHSVNQDIKHKCDICGKAYRLASSLDIHLATHSNETPCLCDVCGKSFKHPSNLRCHKRSHAEEKLTHPHSCDTCGKSFRSKFHLSEHKNVHLNITPYSCSICGKMFHRRIQLRQHRKIHDKGSSFECPKCGVCFNRRGNMTEHMKRHLKEREFNCKVCKVSYKTLSEVVHHRKEHKEQDLADPVNGVERFLCTHCNKLFSSSKELKDHFKDHLNVKFECEICNKQLSNRRSLDYHMKSFHTLERPYPCHHCSESFLSRDARIVHERLHTGEKPYTCSECEMGFRCSSNLAQHMSTHRDLRPWSCEVCPKSFKRKGILSVHMRTHTGEKPFCCDICGRRFTQKNDMLKHQHTHTSAKQAFLCVDCNWAFNTRKELNKHRKNLHSHSGAQSGTNIASTLPPHSQQALLITNEVCQFPITILEEGSNVIVHQIEELGKHPQIIELNTSDSNSQILHFTDSLLQTVVPDSQILSVQDTSCQPATNFASDIAQSVLPPSTEQNWLASQQK